jgi:quercetin dioxygenase-like cupin family protein
VSRVEPLHSAPAHPLADGVSMRPLFGEAAMLNLIEFEPGARVPEHSHPHEQAYAIPGGVEHAAWSEERCLVLDVFHPVREDYRERVGAARG